MARDPANERRINDQTRCGMFSALVKLSALRIHP